MDNAGIAQVFENIGKLLEIQGDLPFKFRAYQRAAHEIEYLSEDLSALAERGELRTVPGVGEEIEKKIIELLNTGRLEYYERLLQQVPVGVLELLEVPGVGPKGAARLWKELGVTNLAQMEAALRDGRAATLPRFGAETAQRLLRQVEGLRARRSQPEAQRFR